MANNYQPVAPQMVYAGLRQPPNTNPQQLADYVNENTPSGNSYLDLLARFIIANGKLPAPSYAQMMGAEVRHFDGAMRCLTGMSAHDWINEYLRLIACDLLEHTSLSFKKIGRLLNFSQSSFSQFVQAYQHMQPSEYRSLKLYGHKISFF